MNRAEKRRLAREQKKEQIDRNRTVITAGMAADELLKIPAVKQLIDKEISRRILQLDLEYTIDMDTVVIWTLRQYGWGEKRLKRFYDDMFNWHRKLRKHYEIPECFPERYMLKQQGIDVQAWYNEKFNQDGTYKQGD